MKPLYLLLFALWLALPRMGISQSFDVLMHKVVMPLQVVEGSFFPFSAELVNIGIDTFKTEPGVDLVINIYASFAIPTDPYAVPRMWQFDVPVQVLAPGAIVPISGQIYADPSVFKMGYSGITVIVWPRVSDANPQNHYFITHNVSVIDPNVSTSLDPAGTPATSIYPNPASSALHIAIAEGVRGEAIFSDMRGRVLANLPLDGSSTRYTLPLQHMNLSPGIYLLRFRSGAMQWTRKVTVQ